MAFFTGEHECKLDAKGRLVLPSRLKSVLPSASKNSIVVRKGLEPNLIIYPLSEFQNIYARINSLNESNFDLEIIDASGKKVYSKNNMGINNLDISCSKFEKGLYIVNIVSSEFVEKKILIIQ